MAGFKNNPSLGDLQELNGTIYRFTGQTWDKIVVEKATKADFDASVINTASSIASVQSDVTNLQNTISTDSERLAAVAALTSSYDAADKTLNDTLTSAIGTKANANFSNVGSLPASVVTQLKGDDGINGLNGTNGLNGKDGVMPKGVISMWSGSSSAIPSGWNLCDGSNGTPNLVGKFIKGGSTPGAIGGSSTHKHTLSIAGHTLSTSQMPSHTHSNNVHSYGWPDGSSDRRSTGRYWVEQNAYNYRRSTNTTGGSGSHSHSGNIASGSNEPYYYTLCYIMKL